jgi:hypothetical protein
MVKCSSLTLAGFGLLSVAEGHGVMTRPISRSLRLATNATIEGNSFAGECPGGTACTWYNQKTIIPGNATNCDRRMRTMGVACGDANPVDFPCTPGHAVPWCAPGTAPVRSACGIFSGGYQSNGRDMRDIDGTPQATWPAGSTQNVSWAITANHGGGFSYRLCKADSASKLDEACFQAGSLAFAPGSTQKILDPAGAVVATIDPPVRMRVGTHPPGSEWSRNPFPMEQGAIEGIPGLPHVFGRGPFNYSVQDAVLVPADLAPGHYVLSWRWDAEQTKQVWAQCSDVLVTSSSGELAGVAAAKQSPSPVKGQQCGMPCAAPANVCPSGCACNGAWPAVCEATAAAAAVAVAKVAVTAAAAAAVSTLPSGQQHVCTGASLGLDVGDCDAWVTLYDSLGGADWPQSWRAPCPAHDLRTDPCGCNGYWQKFVRCNAKRDWMRITEIYMLGPALVGEIPAALGDMDALIALSLVGTRLTGTIPEAVGALPNLEMVWMDHNPTLGGAIPASFVARSGQLQAFELHTSGFNGTLPALDWASIADCTLNGLVFDCPLPKGAETCGCTCK